MYKTVVFDLDGTLLNTLEDLTDPVLYIQKKFDFPLHNIELVRQHVGNGIRKLIIRSIPDGEDNPRFEEVYQEFLDYYQKNCQVKTRAYDGIMELLKELHESNIKMAIVSNKAHGAVDELNEIYFKDYIKVAIGENEAAGIKKKPAPDSVFHALKLLGSKKEEAVYVGDSEVDRATAENAGMDCVLCSWGFRERELLEGLKPIAIIDEPKDLLKIIK